METAGLRTTAGAPEYTAHVPARDADAVARLRAAGAIIFGQTNLPADAADCQTFNPIFGTTRNPLNLERAVGGSSGGAAAAVAAGLTGLDLGSDLGGSIRNPAGYCGVYGLRPSYGIIPTRGHVPGPTGSLAELDMATVGPLARRAADLGLALDVLAGPDAARSAAWRLDLPPPAGRRCKATVARSGLTTSIVR
jgi:amidase